MGQRKNALAVFHRPREGALDVSEKVALHQTLGDRRAVQRDERSVAARAGVVDRAGDELLAGAALTADAHVGVAGGDLFDAREDLL